MKTNHIFEYVNAISSDQDLLDLLKQILAQPDEERVELLHNLMTEAKSSGAPGHFMDFLTVLLDARIADQISEFIQKKS